MFIRPCYRAKNGKRHAYWALVESVRTERGPRQQVVAYLGQMDAEGRLAIQRCAAGAEHIQRRLDEPESPPQWVTVDARRVRVERCLEFGGPWLGRELLRQLGLIEFLERALPPGQEQVPWSVMAEVLVLCRLCEPSSELYIAEHFYRQTAMGDLLGVSAEKVNEQRLYRALDELLPHKDALQVHLKNRLGELFDLDYDLLLYDVTSTYFEGQANGNPQAQRGYSRDHRPDCKQVCIGLVVSRCGMPLGYEVFVGNRSDVTTFPEIIETMEARYGKAQRIWIVDRGMVSQDNVKFLQASGRRYIIGTPKSLLKQFERELMAEDWRQIREELEVKLCPSPDGQEVFILCRSGARRDKEKAMHERFEQRIEEGLRRLQASCIRQKQRPVTIAKRLGRLMGQNSRAAGGFKTEVQAASDGSAWVDWSRVPSWRDWAGLSEGCYILRSNVTEWTPEDLWKAYIQLTEAEGAFRIHKSDLSLRPIWHQKQDRVQAHILVCFLAYVLWKTLGQLCLQAGLGHEPRRVLDELRKLRVVDVMMPTRSGPILRKRCIARPTDHQAILLQRLGLCLPSRLELTDEMEAM
jgi:transposase